MAEVARSFLGLRAKAVLYPHHLGGSREVLERVERQRGGACEQEVGETDLWLELRRVLQVHLRRSTSEIGPWQK